MENISDDIVFFVENNIRNSIRDNISDNIMHETSEGVFKSSWQIVDENIVGTQFIIKIFLYLCIEFINIEFKS